MDNGLYGFYDMFYNAIDNGFYVDGVSFECHENNFEEISFHIASDNSYFVKGVSFSLHKLKQQHKHISFEHTLSDGSARSVLLITKMIREKKRHILMVIIASAALLNILSLSIEQRYMDKVVFVAVSECNTDVLAQITDVPDNVWAIRDKYFPKGMLTALSNREKRVCYYIFCGYTPKMIGVILGINTKTVSSHRVSVMKKIGCANKVDFYNVLRAYYGGDVES